MVKALITSERKNLQLLFVSLALLLGSNAYDISQDDRDLTGCSVELNSYIFNLESLAVKNE